jgi:hypothetical protein
LKADERSSVRIQGFNALQAFSLSFFKLGNGLAGSGIRRHRRPVKRKLGYARNGYLDSQQINPHLKLPYSTRYLLIQRL